ncbi:MAG: hypothetical protein LBJ78_00045 [Puniceicoccales bacterium]|nr:hypothetical protein [Puniceicoccales bacterium]
MRKQLILLSVLVLTQATLWNTSRLRADVFEDLNRIYQAYQANPNDPQVAASYIRLFATWTNDMGKIYAAHGGGGILGFESGLVGGLASRALTQRGNVRSYPFLLGCWLNDSFCTQKVAWFNGGNYGLNCVNLLNDEQKAEIKACCYCGAPAWKACCCDCYPSGRDSCCFNAFMTAFTCGLWSMCWWSNKDMAKAYFMAEMGDEIIQYLYDAFRVRSLREVGNALQMYFVRPVAEILAQACDSRNAE